MAPQTDTAGLSPARTLHEEIACRPDLASPAGALFASLLYPERGTTPTVPLAPAAHGEIAAAAFAFIAERPRRGPKLRVRPLVAHSKPLTLVEILNDDMPFLVDSVMGEIQARGLAAHLVLHPMFKAQRDARGRLEAILGKGDSTWRDGRQESLIVVLLDALAEDGARDLTA